MDFEFDTAIGIDKLDLYYEAHCAGFDGEGFFYSVYFEGKPTDEKYGEIAAAINEFNKPYLDKDIYLGYIDVAKDEDKVSVYLDLGSSDPETEDLAIQGILKALNNVSGIKSVIVNEDCDLF